MGIVGCYSIDLYCDNPERMKQWDYGLTPWEYTGRSETDCLKKARAQGWWINKKKDGDSFGYGYCLCPDHSRRRVK